MIDYNNNTSDIGVDLVKVIECDIFFVDLSYKRMNIALDEIPKRFDGVL